MTIEELVDKRKELGIKQKDIAEALGLSQTYVCEIEKKVFIPQKSLLLAYEFLLQTIEKQQKTKKV